MTSALAEGDKKRGLIYFLAAKVVAYTLFGFGLGYLGASLNISPRLQGWLQIFIGFFLLVTAARLLNIHPIFRYFVITPPKFIFKFLRKQSQAVILGALTILIPCGVTQA